MKCCPSSDTTDYPQLAPRRVSKKQAMGVTSVISLGSVKLEFRLDTGDRAVPTGRSLNLLQPHRGLHRDSQIAAGANPEIASVSPAEKKVPHGRTSLSSTSPPSRLTRPRVRALEYLTRQNWQLVPIRSCACLILVGVPRPFDCSPSHTPHSYTSDRARRSVESMLCMKYCCARTETAQSEGRAGKLNSTRPVIMMVLS